MATNEASRVKVREKKRRILWQKVTDVPLNGTPGKHSTRKGRHAKDLSFSWLLILTAGLLMYTVYGIAISSIPVIISSAIGGLLVIILLIFKVIYK